MPVIKYSRPWTKAEDVILAPRGGALAMQTLRRLLPGRSALEIRFREGVIHRRIIAARKRARDKYDATKRPRRAEVRPRMPRRAPGTIGLIFTDNVSPAEDRDAGVGYLPPPPPSASLIGNTLAAR